MLLENALLVIASTDVLLYKLDFLEGGFIRMAALLIIISAFHGYSRGMTFIIAFYIFQKG